MRHESDIVCQEPAQQTEESQGQTMAVSGTSAVRVVIGTSHMAAEDETLVRRIADVANRANGHQRFSVSEVRSRLAKGDSEPNANRVLHVAFLDGAVVGCCSSTTHVQWGNGGGHWGALAVDPDVQGRGVASALVAAAEQRLLDRGCRTVQIEYSYYPGDPFSERLKDWYEGRLGFNGQGSGFRMATKVLSQASVAKAPGKPAAHAEVQHRASNSAGCNCVVL